ncbi:MAG TPA: PAS domain-containing protein [Candidatus Avoscillospira stercorigallinarum]|uniref:histidine kinase n=1 Tax=Candidatus Avoscillospira stercorigallinarum TaxID=2840708 RepID=A0A9D0Z4M0_9FIRM|nr:PAS domain-containing protein [Candidatus Avoscillospira stercorigallinarum]
MTKRIFQAVCLVAAMVLVLSTGVLLALFYDNYVGRAEQSLRTEAAFVAQGLNTGGEDYLLGLTDRSRRITLVDQDGTVRYDNTADAGQMENHLEREEIQEALSTGSGQSRRVSETLSQETVYYAILLENGMVLRLAATQSSVWALLLTVLQPAAMVVIAALVLGAILAHRAAKAIVAPINSLDLDQPEDAKAYEELSPLLSRIARQKRTIDAQLHRARRQQEQFRLITENMSEGLLVVDSQTNLLSCNSAALRLLGAEKQPENPSVLALNHAEAFRTVIRDALAGRHGEGRLEVGGRSLQLLANPAGQEGEAAGAVILVMDTTEREQREALRREFSANVSHELKTPLTSISGFAELMKSGVVAQKDVMDFSQSIYDEAQRLIHMVEDIIRLSELDETELHRETGPIDLCDFCRREVERMRPEADRRGVTLSLQGEAATVQGNAQILGELVYNLLDNAIKYNKPQGSVTVTVTPGKRVRLRVEDTGIGIPKESQSRVFERFYRVDKSRSDDVSGTGLGLSIVKHAAQFHRARVELQSTEGKGTAITVTFPLEA